MTDLNAMASWAGILIAAASLAYAIISGRSKKFDDRLERIESKLKTEHHDLTLKIAAVSAKTEMVEDRVLVVENDLTHLPDKDVTHRLEIALGEVKGELARVSERMKPIAAMADRMQEALLEKVIGS